MAYPPPNQLSKGAFLIASPEIDQGFYFRSVLILCEHSSVGSFGLVINKPLDIELPEEILNMSQMQNKNVKIRSGGLVQPTQMMLLHSSDQIPDQTMKLCDNVYLGGDLQFLHESTLDPNGPAVRLCFGYSAFGPGELEREFLAGNWFLHEGSANHVFITQEEKLWQALLREKGGKYATLSMMPEDLTLN